MKIMDFHDNQIVRLQTAADPSFAMIVDWRAGLGLFGRCDRSGTICLTELKKNPALAEFFDPDFAQRVLADDRIPNEPRNIRLEDLAAFAEYQREAVTG